MHNCSLTEVKKTNQYIAPQDVRQRRPSIFQHQIWVKNDTNWTYTVEIIGSGCYFVYPMIIEPGEECMQYLSSFNKKGKILIGNDLECQSVTFKVIGGQQDFYTITVDSLIYNLIQLNWMFDKGWQQPTTLQRNSLVQTFGNCPKFWDDCRCGFCTVVMGKDRNL